MRCGRLHVPRFIRLYQMFAQSQVELTLFMPLMGRLRWQSRTRNDIRMATVASLALKMLASIPNMNELCYLTSYTELGIDQMTITVVKK